MARDGVSSEVYAAVIEAVRSGLHRAKDIEATVGDKTDRQVRRALKKGLQNGTLHRPERGVYYLSSQTIIPFDEFQKSINANVCMSGKKQQNITNNIHRSETRFLNTESALQQKQTLTANAEDVRTLEWTRSGQRGGEERTLADVARLILETLGITDCTTQEFAAACSKLATCTWQIISEENVGELVAECRTRFQEQAQNQEIRTPVKYFFGIVRNVVRTEVQLGILGVQKEYLKRLRVGDESVVVPVSISTDALAARAELELAHAEVAPGYDMSALNETVSVAGDFSVNEDPTALESLESKPVEIPREWEPFLMDLQLLCDEKSTFPISDELVRTAVATLYESSMRLEHAAQGLAYLREHDEYGAYYLCNHLNDHRAVQDSITRHYQWSLKDASKREVGRADSTRGKSNPSSNQKQRDERYSAFYELYPDA